MRVGLRRGGAEDTTRSLAAGKRHWQQDSGSWWHRAELTSTAPHNLPPTARRAHTHTHRAVCCLSRCLRHRERWRSEEKEGKTVKWRAECKSKTNVYQVGKNPTTSEREQERWSGCSPFGIELQRGDWRRANATGKERKEKGTRTERTGGEDPLVDDTLDPRKADFAFLPLSSQGFSSRFRFSPFLSLSPQWIIHETCACTAQSRTAPRHMEHGPQCICLCSLITHEKCQHFLHTIDIYYYDCNV